MVWTFHFTGAVGLEPTARGFGVDLRLKMSCKSFAVLSLVCKTYQI